MSDIDYMRLQEKYNEMKDQINELIGVVNKHSEALEIAYEVIATMKDIDATHTKHLTLLSKESLRHSDAINEMKEMAHTHTIYGL